MDDIININSNEVKDAYKQAESEITNKKIAVAKKYILETLKKLEEKKREKALIDEEIRVLKLDIEDIKAGKFDKILERINKSSVASSVTVMDHQNLYRLFLSPGNTVNRIPWDITYTSGTYNIGDKAFYI